VSISAEVIEGQPNVTEGYDITARAKSNANSTMLKLSVTDDGYGIAPVR